ncbi:hypothetical protein HT118_06365 [Escherichia coli]|nr:hypothetical protein [Escherichia coli]
MKCGDWRIILHSPYGRRVHEPLGAGDCRANTCTMGALTRLWLPVMTALLRAFPDTDGKLPDAAIFVFGPEKLLQIVREAVGSSALFRRPFFRECAARALCAGPHAGPSHPLWQQRLRASQLLEIAQGYPDFPVILETLRECLQDVYDLPALERLMRRPERWRNSNIRCNDHYAFAFRCQFIVRLCRGIYVPERRPAGRAPGIRTVAGQRVTAQSTRTGRSGRITRPTGHSPGGRRVATTGSLAEERKGEEGLSRPAARTGANDR